MSREPGGKVQMCSPRKSTSSRGWLRWFMLDNVYFEVNNVQKKTKYEVMSKSNMLGKSKENAILYHDLFTPLALAL